MITIRLTRSGLYKIIHVTSTLLAELASYLSKDSCKKGTAKNRGGFPDTGCSEAEAVRSLQSPPRSSCRGSGDTSPTRKRLRSRPRLIQQLFLFLLSHGLDGDPKPQYTVLISEENHKSQSKYIKIPSSFPNYLNHPKPPKTHHNSQESRPNRHRFVDIWSQGAELAASLLAPLIFSCGTNQVDAFGG